DALLLADRGQLRDGLREEEEALAQDDHARRDLLDEVDALLHVEVVRIFREREEVQRDGIRALEVQGLAAALDAPAEDADGVVADVAAGSGGVDDDGVPAP